jgi:hypothetical protein
VSIEGFYVRDVTVQRAGLAVDRSGGEIKDWANPEVVFSGKGWLGRLAESEVGGNRSAEQATWVLRLPAAVDVTADDRVTVTDQPGTFEVDGPPNRSWTPRGQHHTRVPLRTLEG